MYLMIVFFVGSCFIRLFPKEKRSPIDVLLLWPLGFGLVSFVLFVASIVFQDLFIGNMLVFGLAMCGVYFFISFLCKGEGKIILEWCRRNVYFGLLIVFTLVAMLRYWVKLPFFSFDSWALWGMKAKICFLSAKIPLELFHSKVFLQFVSLPSYPLSLVLNETFLSVILGTFNESALKLISLTFGVVSLFIVYSYLCEFLKPYKSFLVTFVFLFTPMVILHTCGFYAGCADVIMLCYNISAAIMLFRFYLTRDKRYFYLFTTLIAFAFWTKLEGAVFLITYVATMLYVFKGFKGLRLAVRCITLVLLINGVWMVMLLSPGIISIGHGVSFNLLNQRVILMAKVISKETFTMYKWHLFWPILFLLITLSVKRNNSMHYRFFRFLFLSQFLGYCFILTLHSELFEFLSFYPSLPLDRLWFHTFGIACILLGLSLKEIHRESLANSLQNES